MGAKVRTGLDRLAAGETGSLDGLRVGLCCNAASVSADLRHAVDLLGEAPGIDLQVLLAPEHGIRGAAQDMEQIGAEDGGEVSSLRVYSLYGGDEASLRPTPEMLAGLDAVVFDLQDVGARYYTFVYTLSYIMEVAGELGIKVVVLDRPNPIGGAEVEGNLVSAGYRSFVGHHPLAARHGMTVGELAGMFRDAFGVSCELQVVGLEGWRREMYFEDTGLPWVLPSPNMPTPDTAVVYPGGCLYEGTNLSEARGTTRPFELVGAPFLDGERLAGLLAAELLPGAVFRPLTYRPTFHKWQLQDCGGIQTHVTDRRRFKPFLTGLAVVKAARELGGEAFDWRREAYEFVSDRLAIDLLCGGTEIRDAMEAGASLEEIESSWQPERDEFMAQREEYLRYRDR